MTFHFIAASILTVLATGTPGDLLAQVAANGLPQVPPRTMRLQVQTGSMFGRSAGELVISSEGLVYETAERGRARHWAWTDIQQLQILSPTRVSVLTYRDGGWWRFGQDQRVDFALKTGQVSADLVGFLLRLTARPIVSSVAPDLPRPAAQSIAVKHARGVRGSEGVLALYDDGLLYETSRKGELRYWRYADIFAVFPLGPDRLDVVAYEGGAGQTRPFSFQLKEPLSATFANELWKRVNPATPLGGR